MRIHLNIGSNSGDSRVLTGRAVAAIVCAFGPHGAVVAVAPPYYSEPWGFVSSSMFVNTGVMIDFPSDTSENAVNGIYLRLNTIERSLTTMPHRNPDGSYRDRELDIDIIAVDEAMMNTPFVTVPHPRMHLRPFVLRPMHILDPSWRHPILHKTPGEFLETLG